MTIQFVSEEKIAETSSKGNQEKWRTDNRWYKLDQFGYEGLTETVVSTLLERSNIEKETPFRFARYRMERIVVHGRERTGCSSENFLQPDESIITLSHLFKTNGVALGETLTKLSSDKKRILYLAEMTTELTGLRSFPQYLALLFEVDGLFLNDDRHLNNIAVLEKRGKYDYCPIFDNGAGLLSNTQTASMDVEPAAWIKSAVARPFHTSFNRQVIHARNLFGNQLAIPNFTEEDIRFVIAAPLEYYAQRDQSYIFDRVWQTIQTRQKAQKME